LVKLYEIRTASLEGGSVGCSREAATVLCCKLHYQNAGGWLKKIRKIAFMATS